MPDIQWVDPSESSSAVGPIWPVVETGAHEHHDLPVRHRRPRRRTWIALGAVLLLAAAGVGGWLVLKPRAPVRITVAGATVDNAKVVVKRADAELRSYTKAHLGVTATSSRCYFTNAANSTISTDVDGQLWCGPVLFFDGKAPNAYLSFALTEAAPASKGHVELAVASQPKSPDPAPLPGGADFFRPDHAKPPTGVDGLVAPIPPPSPADLFEQVDAEALGAMRTAPNFSVIGSRDYGLRLVSSGYVTHVGRDTHEYSAAPGHKLFAFAIDLINGENPTTSSPHPDIRLSVDSAPLRPVPIVSITAVDRYFAVSVPSTTKSIDLVLRNAGFTQRMSAITGRAAPGNIVVLRGTSQFVSAGADGEATASVDAYGQSFTAHLHVVVYGFQMEFFTPNGPHPSDPSHAYLYVDACYISSDFVDQTSCHSFRGTDLELTPAGGKTIVGKDVGKDNRGYCVFEVPANMRSGRFTVQGSEASGEGWSMTITQPYSYDFELT